VIRIGVVADDLTGACDSAVPFLAAGQVLVGLWPHVPAGDAACAAVSTETRSEPNLANVRGRAAAVSLVVRDRRDLLYRKLDSMLRGSPVADLESARAVVAGRCLVAPALPGEARTTVSGVQRWPGGAVDLRALLAPLVVDGYLELRDAVTDADLDRVAADALAHGDRVLAGSAGLSAALARVLGLGPAPAAPPQACDRPLAVVGSPAAAAQAAFARSRGWAVPVLGPGEVPELDGHDGLVLTGGETAARVLGGAGAETLELLGEAVHRAPLARVRGGRLDGLPVVLKAGSFGGEDAIDRALEALVARPS
jgi:D-threonate/D-erythronate kinase